MSKQWRELNHVNAVDKKAGSVDFTRYIEYAAYADQQAYISRLEARLRPLLQNEGYQKGAGPLANFESYADAELAKLREGK